MHRTGVFFVLIFFFIRGNAQQVNDDILYENFISPPHEAKPRVWWHWMNGNITKDGIRKDLEWMHRVGIGGFHNFEVELGRSDKSQIVDRPLVYMTPEWVDVFKFATKLADSLKLEMAIAASPGFSETGGSWVKPEDGMKKLVWTEIRVKGGTSNIKIAAAPGTTGPFQNIPIQPFGERKVDISKNILFYRDVAVLAYKLPQADRSLSDLGVVVTSSSNNFTLSQLTDGDLSTGVLLPKDTVKGYAWIQFAFPQPQTVKAVSMVGGGNPGMFGMGADPADGRALEASDDGVNYRLITHIPPGAILQQTIPVPETTARYFRITVKNPPDPFNRASTMGLADKSKKNLNGTEIAEIVLHTADRINRFEEKSAFAPAGNLLDTKTTAASNDVINVNDVINITDKLNADGTIDWIAPERGEWKIIRLGYSLLGTINHPASYPATGLEVDKLDPVAVKNYFTNYLERYKNATGSMMGSKGALQYLITDSWEAGAQNWTTDLPAEFQKRRGYSIIPWLPVLTGAIVKSADASEAFLFDFRKTLGEMVAAYHYDALTDILARYGMKRYSESHEDGRAFIGDGMEVKRTAAIPMSALWTPSPVINQNDQTRYTIDIRESASVAHLYGQNLVAAESLTALGMGGSAWAYYPGNLKPSADLELASGVNRFVIHCSPHQPVDNKIPGLGLGPFGQWYTRHETWAEQAKVWNDYLARSSYLLQQGRFAADIVYYYGEDNNITNLFGKRPPAIPDGYNYDFINTDALINILSVKDGKLITPGGMSYSLLVLDSSAVKMALPALRKLRELVRSGATVTGIKPIATPSLTDDPNEFNKLVNEIWASSNSKVTVAKPLSEVLSSLNILPDFEYTKPQDNTQLMYVHRRLSNGDIYWVNNRNDRNETVEAIFRVSGKVPQIWHPETGRIEAASYKIENGRTTVLLNLTPNDAVFVVFRSHATKNVLTLPAKTEREIMTVEGSWKVMFQPNREAPASATFDRLVSYTENSDAGIRYFSGTATYTKNINLRSDALVEGAQLWLDLGDVKNLGEVLVNGKLLGIVWKKPFRVDVTNALKAGENKLEIKVTNLWVNRLIGDAQPGVTNRITYTTLPFYKADSPLQPSGLLGPVKIISIRDIRYNNWLIPL
ncbi:glycosyl hydrolase [Chitinophaga sp. CF418]|uniref:glycosyl hydrolase n=1 Tax=Chitinophaga sp. CF418 TaxID=1855287 RepID=UPI0009176562|nr:glycosyl hydrolase [Chitinophaga sp. CF418]SHN40717.1 F5/8 type C domain-containing protein [Chitinophaga sp. CF418]